MSKTSTSQDAPQLGELVPKRIRSFFGEAPVLPFEDPDAFDALHAEFVASFVPRDVVEHIWIRDLADIYWGLMRLRNIRRSAIENSLPYASAEIMAPKINRAVEEPDDYVPGDKSNAARAAEELLRKAARGGSDHRIFFNDIVKSANVTHDMIRSVAYTKALKTISALDGAIHIEQQRFDQLVRNLERRRSTNAAMERSFGLARPGVVDVDLQEETRS